MDVYQSSRGDDSIYPDGPSIDESLRQLDTLSNDQSQPFFLAVGILRPHLPFGAPEKYMQAYRDIELPPIPHPEKPLGKTTWHRSGEFMAYNRWGRDPNVDAEFADQVRRHYAACVSYADAQVGKLIGRLKSNGDWDNTIVVLWGDHGWHLGEHAIWGKHSLFEESLHSPLIIRSPTLQFHANKTDSIVESIDLFPTLCELAGLPMPTFTDGSSIVSMLTSADAPGHSAIGYFRNASTIRTDNHRLVLHRDGNTELYDHATDDGETKNVADQYPEIVRSLSDRINERLTATE
jgi:iduronate 2-sulfatase